MGIYHSGRPFLRNMVRAVVGTLIEVGRGKLSIDGFRQVIEKRIDAVPEAQCRDTPCFGRCGIS